MDTTDGYPERVSRICNDLSELSQKMETLKCLGFELAIYDDLSHLSQHNATSLMRYLLDVNAKIEEINNAVTGCESLTRRCLSCFSPAVNWLPQRPTHLQVAFLDGDDPWSFWVTYRDKTELNELHKELRTKYEEKSLKPFVDAPEVGTLVGCIDRKLLFRGVIISNLPRGRSKVLNIDTTCVKVIGVENMFQADKNLSELHAFAVNCCLLEGLKKQIPWNEELSGIFRSSLRECELEMTVTSEINSLPPKFTVQLYGYNEALGMSANLSEWIINRLLPALIKDKSTIEGDIDIVATLPEAVLDPYDTTWQENFPTKEGLSEIEDASEESPKITFKIPDNLQSTVSENPKADKKTKFKMKASKKDLPGVPCDSGPGQYQLTIQKPIKKKYMVSKDVNKEEKCKDFKCGKVKVEPGEQNNGSVKLMLGYTETFSDLQAEIGSEYQPKDDIRICQFFAKKGYCWKTGCTKEHINNSQGKWTTDVLEVCKDIPNKLIMPDIGTIVDITVTTVLTANSFYAHLPNKYSEIEEYESEKLETLASLTSSINSHSAVIKHEFLEVDPCCGELLLAYGLQCLWLRARVLEIFDNSVQVFYIDYGLTEIISERKNLRKICPEYLHLPCQAILCFLSDLYLIEDDTLQERGRLYLEEMVLKNKIKAKVVRSNVLDSELEIIIYNLSGVNINEAICLKGYCIKV